MYKSVRNAAVLNLIPNREPSSPLATSQSNQWSNTALLHPQVTSQVNSSRGMSKGKDRGKDKGKGGKPKVKLSDDEMMEGDRCRRNEGENVPQSSKN